MIFLLDENFPKSITQLLSLKNHHWIDIRGTNLEGCTDIELFTLAQQQQAVLLTTDRDFFHTIPHIQKEHQGIVVIALRQPNRNSIQKRLEWFLEHFQETDMRNKVFELRDHSYIVFPRE